MHLHGSRVRVVKPCFPKVKAKAGTKGYTAHAYDRLDLAQEAGVLPESVRVSAHRGHLIERSIYMVVAWIARNRRAEWEALGINVSALIEMMRRAEAWSRGRRGLD